MSRILTGLFQTPIVSRPSDRARGLLGIMVGDLQVIAGECPEAIEDLAETTRILAAPLRMALRTAQTKL